jgi:hypothetical protein
VIGTALVDLRVNIAPKKLIVVLIPIRRSGLRRQYRSLALNCS